MEKIPRFLKIVNMPKVMLTPVPSHDKMLRDYEKQHNVILKMNPRTENTPLSYTEYKK